MKGNQAISDNPSFFVDKVKVYAYNLFVKIGDEERVGS